MTETETKSAGWPRTTLGAIVETAGGVIKTGPFGSQVHASDYTDDASGTPIVMPSDMVDGRVSDTSIKRVGKATAARLTIHRLQVGDVVLARRGDIGRLARVTEREDGWLCGTGSVRIHAPANGLVDSTFLLYALRNPAAADWLLGHAVGATMPNLNSKIVASLPLRWPDTPTQHRIASVLSAFDELIEINERRIELLEGLARSLYREWFVRFRFPGHEDVDFVDSAWGRIPRGWKPTPLGELARSAAEGVHPTEVEPDQPYVGLEHLPRRQTTLREWGSTSNVTSRKLRFRETDTLFGKIRPYFHKVVWAPSAGVASSDTIVFRPTGNTAALTNAIASSDEFVGHAVGTSNGTKMPRANVEVLLGYTIVLPTLGSDVVIRFEKSAEVWLSRAAHLVSHNRALATTRDLLLPRLVTGRLDISDIDLDDLLSVTAEAA